MNPQKYSVNQHQISTFLAFVKDGQIAIPEVQRPFVWDSTRVRDLIDSLYRGYPIGYVITWQNPNVRLKDGRLSEGKKILIDGQQRITALRAAVLGEDVVNREYDKVKIKIAFNPITETFEVQNPAILKDKIWISDISDVLDHQSIIQSVKKYMAENPDIDENIIERSVAKLLDIHNKQIGTIDLAYDLDIETVTTIFIRINKQGVELSQADFAMSKIASNERFNGPLLRKAIDYFCHLAVAPQFFEHIKGHDKEFASTDYFKAMTWLKNEKDDLYDPSYTDVLRVTFTSEFQRGRLSDLVSLLSGRNFENREYEDRIAEDTFMRMKKSLFSLMNETNFKRFVMIVRSAGFISSELIRSQNVLNFAYIVYLKLRELKVPHSQIARLVSRWFVLSVLTGRYGSAPESMFDYDIKQISSKPFSEYLQSVENAELSEAFWEVGLIQRLNTAISSSPIFNVFQASMVKGNDKGFLSRDITVADIILYKGDIHHIFPKNYLKNNNKSRGEYNQIANYVLMQQEININIGAKSPDIYFNDLQKQCTEKMQFRYGGIDNMNELMYNLKTHCIPESIFDMKVENYGEFLEQRRKLMAQKMKNYYYSL
ncbi:MAG: DUF262 domain-containing protein [Ignavibacteriales bacterium]|nr:DUF262 domain-containing protein [Ignavibacteriales bacterium]